MKKKKIIHTDKVETPEVEILENDDKPKKGMSTTDKVIIGLIIALVIALAVVYFKKLNDAQNG